MSEIKTEVKQNADGSLTITDAHSTADIIRWLLTQDSKETILYLLKEQSPQRTWAGLTNEDYQILRDGVVKQGKPLHWMIEHIEAKLKEKNT